MAKIINVQLNENTIEYDVSPDESLFDLLYAINEFCDNEKLPPLKWMTVDGEKYDLENLPENIDKSLNDISSVSFWTYSTDNPSEYENKKNTYYIEETTAKIDELSQQLESVAGLLSAGKDQEAMSIIRDFSEIMESCINIFAVHGEQVGQTINQEFFENTNDILSDLMDAMERKDSILIGDLMEYEFAPIIQNLKDYLMAIK